MKDRSTTTNLLSDQDKETILKQFNPFSRAYLQTYVDDKQLADLINHAYFQNFYDIEKSRLYIVATHPFVILVCLLGLPLTGITLKEGTNQVLIKASSLKIMSELFNMDGKDWFEKAYIAFTAPVVLSFIILFNIARNIARLVTEFLPATIVNLLDSAQDKIEEKRKNNRDNKLLIFASDTAGFLRDFIFKPLHFITRTLTSPLKTFAIVEKAIKNIRVEDRTLSGGDGKKPAVMPTQTAKEQNRTQLNTSPNDDLYKELQQPFVPSIITPAQQQQKSPQNTSANANTPNNPPIKPQNPFANKNNPSIIELQQQQQQATTASHTVSNNEEDEEEDQDNLDVYADEMEEEQKQQQTPTPSKDGLFGQVNTQQQAIPPTPTYTPPASASPGNGRNI